jgi:outer membrane lipoprotein carrier protein
MQLQDNFGQTTSLAFSRIEHNPSMPRRSSAFTPPAGVDVIGE